MGPVCVLLVEDDLITRRIVANYLASCFYDVIEAENGRIALDILGSPQGDSVNIILTDNVMPEVTGLELIVKLVQAKRWRHLPVIIMSSEMREEVVQQAMAAGACDFLHKPVQRTQINALWKHTRKGSRTRSDVISWDGGLAAPSQSEDDSGATEAACQQATGLDLREQSVDVSERKQEGSACHRGASAYWEGGLSVGQYDAGMSNIAPTRPYSWPPPSMCTTASILGPWSQPPQGLPLEIRPLDLEKTVSIASSASTALRCLVPSLKEDICWKEEKEAHQNLPPIFGPSVSTALPPHHQLLLQSFQAVVAKQQHTREAMTANRRAAIARFRAKRAARCFEKKVRYVNRKKLAETRPRVRGQFCKAMPDAAAKSSMTEA